MVQGESPAPKKFLFVPDFCTFGVALQYLQAASQMCLYGKSKREQHETTAGLLQWLLSGGDH